MMTRRNRHRNRAKAVLNYSSCLLFLLSLGCVVVVAVSCSTQKANWGNVAYHNTTAHFNVWWNGNESLKEGVKKLSHNAHDDYTQILPIYKLGTREESMSVNPEMDRALEKGVKGIKQHSIFIKGEEHVPYVRKCYLLTALASFYKHDYVTASSTAQMMKLQYVGTEEADAAAVLYARCLTADQQFSDAETELDALVVDLGKGNFAKSQRADLYMAMAECTLPQEKYKKTVQFIKLALEANPGREAKARLYFIMAQIYQKLDKRPVATKYYEEALSKTQDYTMEFNARLNIASCADLEHADIVKLERSLDRMIADRKNMEFLDQIYYAKGEMFMGVKDAQKACENYAKSVAVSTTNTAQKAKSSLRMAEIQYELYENYDVAQRYYDTAMAIIAPTYPHYFEIKSRYDILTSLVQYTRLIDRNDSILVVANMPQAERDSLIAKKISDYTAAEEAAREQALLDQLNAETKAMQNTLQGDWYFYNPTTVQQGKNSFKQRWGIRPLEDYWFLSKKGLLSMGSMVAGVVDEELPADETTDSAMVDSLAANPKSVGRNGNPNDPHDKAFYLKDLPTSQEQRDSMNTDIALALLNAGYIYYDGIKNNQRAVDSYLRMVNEYTDHDEVVQAFYMLYKIYAKQGNTPSANYYKNMVLMGFPDGDFANLIRDEEYYKVIAQRTQLLNEDYEDLYAAFRRGRFLNVIAQSQQVASTYPDNAMVPKFRFWEALSYAYLDSTQRAISILEKIVAEQPSTDSIVPIAQAQLEYLRGGGKLGDGSVSEDITEVEEQRAKRDEGAAIKPAADPEEQQLSPEAQLFRFKETMQHYVVVLVNDKRVRATDLQYKLSDFNAQYYSNKGYKVNSLLFTDSVQLLTIHRFINAQEASDYWTHLQQDESPLKKLSPQDYTVFPISTQNYMTFYNRKNVDAYKEFFEHYYLH